MPQHALAPSSARVQSHDREPLAANPRRVQT